MDHAKKLKPGRRVCVVDVQKIKPSPENDEIYHRFSTDNEDDHALVESIRERGVDEPIILSKDKYVISGHRRLAAALEAGLTDVPARYLPVKREQTEPYDYKAILAEFNICQREKNCRERILEKLAVTDLDENYEHYVSDRSQADEELTRVQFLKPIKRSKISPQKQDMVDAITKIVVDLKPYWPLTDRTIHYGLLNDPPNRNAARKSLGRYQNNSKCYGDLCDLVTRMRLEGIIPFACISDETRVTEHNPGFSCASRYLAGQKARILAGYHRDLLQSQPCHVEIVVEKLTVFNYLKPIAEEYKVPITVSRGNSGLDARFKMAARYQDSGKNEFKILLFTDFDADGEMIAGTWQNSLTQDFNVPCQAFKVALTYDQAQNLQLVNANNLTNQKTTSSNYDRFVEEYGEDCPVYELEAISPNEMQGLAKEAITSVLDMELFNSELEEERKEASILESIRCDLWSDLEPMIDLYF